MPIAEADLKNITPEKALEILNSATGDVRGSREEHNLILACLSVLGMTVTQWRAMQDPPGSLDAPGGPEDPGKLLTEG